ncbi:MAG: RIP metalloprotease RseP [Bacteroidota bacterium]
MDYLIIVGQLMLSLSILVVLHEMGHFLPARWFETRVEKFYLFFDPYFALFKKKIGETEYGVGWLPLGGYVKISGMIDESMDREQMQQPPQPWEFRSKPAWQRLIIMLGGVTVNFILGLFLYGMVLWVWGVEYLPAENAQYGIHADSLGLEMGLQHGDHILSIGGEPFDKFNDALLVKEIVINDADQLKVRRNGQERTIPIDRSKWVGILSSATGSKSLFIPRFPTEVLGVADGRAADEAGLQAKDRIVGVDDLQTPYYSEFRDALKAKKGQQVFLAIERDGQRLQKSIQVEDRGTIGIIVNTNPADFFETETQTYSLAQAFPEGARKGVGFLALQIKAFGKMFSGEIKASDSLGGFGSIGKMFGATWDWQNFWRMTAILSLILAFMNLLPIPALDGGHVMFLLYEIVTGRKPSDKFLEYATMVGFVILLALLLYANGLDIVRAFF